MKVLAFAPQYLPIVGGIEILVDTLAQQFRQRSIETVVVTDRPGDLPECEVVNGVPVYRLDFSRTIEARDSSGLLQSMRRLSHVFETEVPDLLHVHAATQTGAWFVDRLLKKLSSRPPLIVTQHNPLEPDRTPTVVRDLLLAADAVTAVSSAVLDSALQFAPRAGFSTVILNGIEEAHVPARAQQDASLFHRLICVGRLHHDKGFDLAISALAQLRTRGIEAELIIVGGGQARRDLEHTAATCGVADRVRFRDMQSHSKAREEIGQSSVVLIPSRMLEGLPLVALEAAHAGIPCVATNRGGLPEAVEHGVTGLLVPPDDAAALASAVMQLLGDIDLRREFGQNARRSSFSSRARYQHRGGAGCNRTIAGSGLAMPEQPLVSVIVCVRDGERFLDEALDSIAAQEITDLETIVIDDGSIDDSAGRARRHASSPFVVSQPGLGIGAAINHGIRLARGRYLAFLDCDDVWPKERLKAMIEAVERDRATDYVFGNVVNTDEALNPINKPQPARLLGSLPIKRASVDRIGAFRADVAHAGIVDWMSRAEALGLRFEIVDRLVLLRRIHGDNIGSRDRPNARRDLLRVIRDHHRRTRQ